MRPSGPPRWRCSTSAASSPPTSSSALADVPDSSVPALAALAHEVRLEWCGDTVEVEGILSAKTGGCPEDCHFCSQSASFETPVQATPFLDTDEVHRRRQGDRRARRHRVLHRARHPRPRRAHDAPHPRARADRAARRPASTSPSAPASSPTTRPAASPRVASTATTTTSRPPSRSSRTSSPPTRGTSASRPASWCAEHGMELCCGVLLGMGETDEQRLELVGQLRAVDPAEVPINFLNPRPGTPLRRPPAGRAARGHPLDRPVPPRPARRSSCATPAAARSPSRELQALGHHLGHQRPHRRQLPHDARALARGGPPDARRPPDADRRAVQGVLGVAGPEPAAHCIWCGTALATHPDKPCRRELDPPRFCPTCGRRLRVKVHPAGWEAVVSRPRPPARRPGLARAGLGGRHRRALRLHGVRVPARRRSGGRST